MSANDYTTAACLPLHLARDPRYRDLVSRFAKLQSSAVRNSILSMIGEATK